MIENMLRLRTRLLPAAQTAASGSNREADKAAAHWQHNTNLGEIFPAIVADKRQAIPNANHDGATPGGVDAVTHGDERRAISNMNDAAARSPNCTTLGGIGVVTLQQISNTPRGTAAAPRMRTWLHPATQIPQLLAGVVL
jgi:hypothetical protein